MLSQWYAPAIDLDPVSSHPLRVIHWFKTVENDALTELWSASQARHYREGDPIWTVGDATTHFAFVSRGLVQIVKPTARGQEVTLGIFGPGEGVGNIAVMDRAEYPASAVAASEHVTILRIQSAVLMAMMKQYPDIMTRANTAFRHKARALLSKIDVLSAGPISARLALLFLHLAERFGDEGPSGELFVPIALSRGALARLVAAREETVIRVLSRWKERKWLSTLPDGFTIHAPTMLETAVSDDTEV